MEKIMSRLKIATPNKAQLTVERLYKDLERRIIASPPGLCPVDLQLSFLKMCHAQTCGKCVPCRVGLGQLQNLMEDVLAGKATLKTLDLIRDTASDIVDSADCAIGYEAAHMVLAGLEGFREDYVYHIEHGGKCSCHITQPVPCVALCPAGVDIPGYIALVKEERYADAVKLIRKDNPFPTACALICEHPCEARCRRNMIDSAINIRGLKRMAVDNARANTVPVPEKAESTGKKVAIIGGGPGGLSAASCLTGMLTDQGTGGGERIVLADQLYGICITLFLHQCYVTGDIHTCGAQRHTGNRLGNMAGTFSPMFNVIDIILTEAFQSGQYHMGRLVTDGTVSGVHNVGSGIPDQIQCLQGGFACQYILHQVLQLPQSHTARHTFTTGLGMTHFQKRKLQVHRT
jgi:hypothetical protein